MSMFSQGKFTYLRLRPIPFARVAVPLALLFTVVAPLATFVLLAAKGLPAFTAFKTWEVMLWVYQVTWMPALLSGIILGVTTARVTSVTGYLHQPYDVGRCLSVGAIVGALAEALITSSFRIATHHPFSAFWIAGATIAGCVTGGVLTAIVLRLVSPRNG